MPIFFQGTGTGTPQPPPPHERASMMPVDMPDIDNAREIATWPSSRGWATGAPWQYRKPKVGNILSWRLIMKYFLRSFSPFR